KGSRQPARMLTTSRPRTRDMYPMEISIRIRSTSSVSSGQEILLRRDAGATRLKRKELLDILSLHVWINIEGYFSLAGNGHRSCTQSLSQIGDTAKIPPITAYPKCSTRFILRPK